MGGSANWAGIFSHDLMRAASYRYANVSSRKNSKNSISFVFIDRQKCRRFAHPHKTVETIKHYFEVCENCRIFNRI